MSFVAILHKLSDAEKLLWIVDVANPSPWGTFAYRNQAAAFLILVLIVSGVLYFFYERQSAMKLKQGGPHLFLFLIIFLLFGSIWLALSRSGIILAGFLVFIFCLMAAFRYFRNRVSLESFIPVSLFFGLMVLGGLFITQLSDWNMIEWRIKHAKESINDIESDPRFLSTKATWEMAQDKLIYGWGAGSFQYVFPAYQKNYDILWYYYYREDRGWIGRKGYSYAHNDWVQFLAEYGLVGCIFLLAMFFCLFEVLRKTFLFKQNNWHLFAMWMFCNYSS